MTNRFDSSSVVADFSNLWSRTCSKRVVRESADGGTGAMHPRDHVAEQCLAVAENPSLAARWGSERTVRVLWLVSPLTKSEVVEGLPKLQLNALDMTGTWPPEGTAAVSARYRCLSVAKDLFARAESRVSLVLLQGSK